MSLAVPARPIDYSLYLVTGRELLPPGADFFDVLEKAIKGGVSIVQIREKNAGTREFLHYAQYAKETCHRHGVPIIINDRIDIALAIGADGVHLGQKDMPIQEARKVLPPGTIIGISVNDLREAEDAVREGADYVGIGPVWTTQTKSDLNPIVGVRSVGKILDALGQSNTKAVAIAGINSRNVLRTLYGSVSPSGRALDGVAVVSDIMASKTPFNSAKSLSDVIRSFNATTPISPNLAGISILDTKGIVKEAASLLTKVRELGPLVHQITNNVVMNQSANCTLALGASPIMATAVAEMEDLSRVSGALLVNFGTISDKAGMLEAGRWANATRKPIVFDPVAVGVTKFRRAAAEELLNAWQASIIKGNAAEIGALADSNEVQSRGVDSVGGGFADPANFIKKVARKERCIVVMTGKTDWISDGNIAISTTNGHELLGNITGSGCIVGTSVATFCAASSLSAPKDSSDLITLVRGDLLSAALGGVLAITIASELAASRKDVQGTGTFLPALIDELYNLTPEKITERARVEIH